MGTDAEEYNSLPNHAILLPCCFPTRQLKQPFVWFPMMLAAEPTQKRMVRMANGVLTSIEESVDGHADGVELLLVRGEAHDLVLAQGTQHDPFPLRRHWRLYHLEQNR